MADIQGSLKEALGIGGATGCALADYESGMCLGTEGGSATFNLEVAAAGNAEVVRSKLKVMQELGLSDAIQDILITLGKEYHLIMLRPGTSLFMYLALSRSNANLALARHKLQEISKALEV